MPENKTGINLNEFLSNQLVDWGLDATALKKYFITDGAPNIANAISMSSTWTRIPCFDHLLQLSIKDVEKDNDILDEIISKAKRIVSHFKRSTIANSKLKEAQKTLHPNETPLKLIQQVETRWNSTYLMLNRLFKLRTAMCIALAERGMPENFTNEEWNVIEAYINVLSPVKQVTTIMEGDKYPTVSSYIPMVLGLLTVLEYDENVSNQENELAEKYRQSITSRFHFVYSNEILITSMMIDPRYKDRFLDEDAKRSAFQILLKQTKKLRINASDAQRENNPDSTRDADTGIKHHKNILIRNSCRTCSFFIIYIFLISKKFD